MVIMDENRRLLRALHFLKQSFCELFVGRPVLLPVGFAKDRARMSDVAQRPEAFVGESKVISVLLLSGEPDPAECVLRMIRRHPQTIVLVYGFAVSIACTVCDPCAV